MSDHEFRRYHRPTFRFVIFWIDLDMLNVDKGAGMMRLEALCSKVLGGGVSRFHTGGAIPRHQRVNMLLIEASVPDHS